MKKIIYDYEKIMELVRLLDTLEVKGIQGARTLAGIAAIIDTGTQKETPEQEEKDDT